MSLRGGLLRQAPRVTLALMAGPVLAGLAGTFGPAFGLMPPFGLATDLRPDLAEFRALLRQPGLASSVWLSVGTGAGATIASLLLTTLLVAALHGTRMFVLFRRALAPLLSVPHAAAALGLAFLIAPSGWIARLISPGLTGWQVPPDLLILNDPAGLSLSFGLVTKEVPFLFLMMLAALPQVNAARRMQVAASLGHSRSTGFLLAVFPAIYRQIRLPVYAVLAYAMTAVEMAMILGPTRPATLSARITEWMSDPDLSHRGLAAAAAVLQLALVLGTLLVWRGAERLVRHAACRIAGAGYRGRGLDRVIRQLAVALGTVAAAGLIAGLAGLALWSVAGLWSFPDAWPDSLTTRTWAVQGPDLLRTAGLTLAIAAAATAMSVALVLACLQAEHVHGLTPGSPALWLLYLPLIVPQVAFLPGLQGFALSAGLDGTAVAVALIHLVFVLPYVYLSLGPAWRAWDLRIGQAGAALGAGSGRVFWHLRLPMLLRPVLTAAAVGLAVSVGQYLPTLLIGAGRIETLTTEAVALSAGGNRRLIGAATLLQMTLPALGFALALLGPALAFRHRRGMGEGT